MHVRRTSVPCAPNKKCIICAGTSAASARVRLCRHSDRPNPIYIAYTVWTCVVRIRVGYFFRFVFFFFRFVSTQERQKRKTSGGDGVVRVSRVTLTRGQIERYRDNVYGRPPQRGRTDVFLDEIGRGFFVFPLRRSYVAVSRRGPETDSSRFSR